MFKKIFLVINFSFIALLLAHCGQESTGDTAARDQDRDRETLNIRDRQNQIINGFYRGKTPSADIFLSIEATRLSNSNNAVTSYSVPVPALAGSLVVSPKLSTAATSEPVQYAFLFDDGTYDPRGGDAHFTGGRLSITLKDGKASNVSCKISSTRELNCVWNITSNTQFTLTPVKQSSLSTLSDENPTDFAYVGQNDKFNVVIQFESGVITRDGSKIPEPTIMGYILFFTKSNQRAFPTISETQAKYAIKDGTYDLLGGRISVVIDDDSQVNMDCKILKEGATLNCRWHTRVPQEFTVRRIAKK